MSTLPAIPDQYAQHNCKDKLSAYIAVIKSGSGRYLCDSCTFCAHVSEIATCLTHYAHLVCL